MYAILIQQGARYEYARYFDTSSPCCSVARCGELHDVKEQRQEVVESQLRQEALEAGEKYYQQQMNKSWHYRRMIQERRAWDRLEGEEERKSLTIS